MSEETNYFNTAVLTAIRKEYVKCGEEIREIANQMATQYEIIMDEAEAISWNEYEKAKLEFERLKQEKREADIRYGVWSQAREICLDIINGME